MGLSHGEGLSGQRAVEDHGGEKLVFSHAGEEEADAVRLLHQLLHHVLAVDVVNFASMGLQILVQEGLEGSYLQLSGGMGDGKDSPFPGQDIGDLVALPCPIVGAGICCQQVRQKLLGIDPEEDPVTSSTRA